MSLSTLPTTLAGGETGHTNPAHNQINLFHNEFINGAATDFYKPDASFTYAANLLMMANARSRAGGVAALDGSSKILTSQIPASVLQANTELVVSGTPTTKLSTYSASGGTATGGILALKGGRGTSTVPAVPQAGDMLGELDFAGQISATVGQTFPAAFIRGLATSTWALFVNAGAKLQFFTTADNSVSASLALTLDQDQSATFAGAVVAQSTLAVTGVATFGSANGAVVAPTLFCIDSTQNFTSAALSIVRLASTANVTLKLERDNAAVVTTGQVLAALIFGGATNGSHTTSNTAQVRGVASETFGASNSGGRLEWLTTLANGATTAASVRGGISDAGTLYVGTTLAAAKATIDQSGMILALATTGGVGYGTGAGANVNQASSKSTAVTNSVPTGTVTCNAAALAGGASVQFTLTNTTIGANDVVIAQHVSGGTLGAYQISSLGRGSGSTDLRILNTTGGSLSEAIVIQFCVIKGAAS